MSFANPTRLKIGMHGSFAGREFQLVGRSVLGVEINGETYYWNEFNLETTGGETATLVYEETDGSGEWRLFREFEPDYPLSAADAAQKQVGDKLNLTGTPVRVTLVQSSRVYFVEGRAPEGVKVGSEANYFNAESGDVMQVVSWTGDEVEYYNGVTLSPGSTEKAFHIPAAAAPKIFTRYESSSRSYGSGNNSPYTLWLFLIICLFIFVFAKGCYFSGNYEAAPVKHLLAPSPPLIVGNSGAWDGKNYRITAHALMEIAEVSIIYERNEYELTDDASNIVLLVCGEKPGDMNWTLFTPLSPLQPPTAAQCAAQKIGDAVNIDGVTGTIHDLFQSTVRGMDNIAPSNWHTGDILYSYAASSSYNNLLVRWDKWQTTFYRGKTVPAKAITATFTNIVAAPQ